MLKRLSNYAIYLEKLENYATASGVTIVYGEEDGDGSYSPGRRRIKLDNNMSETREIAVLLHELGHCIDDTFSDNRKFNIINRAYVAIDSKRYTAKHLQTVLECEERAWANGRAIAKQLKIPLGKWYDKVKQECLDHYKE